MTGEDFLQEVLKETGFFPAISQAVLILMILPATTCSVGRSFSTLMQVKTSDNHVPLNYVPQNKTEFIDEWMDKFSSDWRRIQFLFDS